jgi:hypothetical protein
MVQVRRWFSLGRRADVALGLGFVGLVDSFAWWPLGLLLAWWCLVLVQRERRAGKSGGILLMASTLASSAIAVSLLAGLVAVTAARARYSA